MKGRIRIATVGVMATMLVTALASSAGAASSTWNVKADGGFVSLTVLNKIQLAGGGSEADANSGNVAEAMGNGICVSASATSNPCPTSATSSLSGVAYQTTQTAIQNGATGTAVPTPAGGTDGNCTLPLNLSPLANIGLFCGQASASEASGAPTATGSGSLASVQLLDLSTTGFLSALGLGLPTAGSSCSSANATAATTSAGTGAAALTGTVGSLLSTVNGLLGSIAKTPLTASSVDNTDSTTGTCSILSGLLNELPVGSALTGLLDELTGLANAANLPPLLSVTLGGSTSSVSTSADGSTYTAHAHQQSVDINILGMLDIQVTPTDANVTVDPATGAVVPTCSAGVISVTTGSGLPTVLGLGSLGNQISSLLNTLGSGTLGTLLGGLLNFDPDGILSCTTTATGATADTIDLNLLPNLPLIGGSLLSLDLGNVEVSGSTTSTTPSVVTQAAVTPTPALVPALPAAPAAVPNVTTVHTGEFWSGILPIILLSGMGLAGITLVGRRRFISVARTLSERSGKSRS